MSKATRSIPNPLTTLRVLLIPILWLFAYLNQPVYLAAGLLLAVLSDAFDGRLARRFPQFTNGKYDSLADKALTFSVVCWLILLRPHLFTEHLFFLSCAALIYLISMLTGKLKFGHLPTLHLYSGRIAGIIQAIFVLHTFLTPTYSPLLFYSAIGLFILSATEELLIQLLYNNINQDTTRTILNVKQRSSRKGAKKQSR